MNDYLLGLSCVFTSSIIWGVSPALISRYGEKVSETAFTAVRSLFGVTGLIFVFFFIQFTSTSISLNGLVIVFISAILGPLIGPIMYIKTIKLIGGGNAVTISYLYIFFAQIFSTIFTGEKPLLYLYIGSMIALLGIYYVYVGEQRVVSGKGLIYGLITALSWGMASTILKIALGEGDPLSIALLRNLFTLLLLLPLTFKEWREIFRDKGVLFTVSFTGVLGLGIGMWLFIIAIEKISILSTVLITSITPILTRILSTHIAHEKPNL